MSRTFEIHVKEHPEILVQKASVMAQANAIHFIADEVQGHFSGKGLQGTYRFENDVLVVEVVKKPALVTWKMVEKMLHQFFA
ncbi:MAG: hypothetical protein Kow0060_09000 [Methylohalobius crimeensis]|uniref:hypothetical protein n=1 Tax=Methylohalobius crimeensis TaxID=244365 RepID=UPI0003B5DF2D|nr:hypothetical protein [Methylohalobius crimeensis]